MQVYCTKQHANHEGNRFCTQCGEPLPLSVGQIVEHRYEIVRMLGYGGFGRTYLAVDLKSSQNCVVKEFAPQVEEKQDLQKAKELFQREASVLQQLQHPQIPRFHAWLQANAAQKDFFFLVQDYVEGDNYLQLLDGRSHQGQYFSEEEVTKLLEQILPVLSYIHSQNVVHRDISPDNLILRQSDNLPMLIDFGAVKQLPASQGFWFTQMSGNKTILGKKGYAPEEQLRQGKAFPSSDLYSLAVTVLVLLTGKEPQHLYDSYQGIWGWGKEIRVTPKLEGILKKMLSYKPSDRYQRADDVLKDLQSSVQRTLNPYITRLKTMVAAPGGRVISQFKNQTQAIAKTVSLPIWLRPFAVSLVGTSVVVLIVAGGYTLVNALIRNVSSISLPSISLPALPKLPLGGNSPKGQSNSQESGRISQILTHRQQLGIPDGFFNSTVNQMFYTKHPDFQGRNLTSKSEDSDLRREWYNVAEDLLGKIEQADLTKSARRKLGSYSGRDYQTWKQQAQAGQLGNYTIEQLTNDTNQKFDELFPGERQGKDQQTLGQIWYAIAADKVSKLQPGKNS